MSVEAQEDVDHLFSGYTIKGEGKSARAIFVLATTGTPIPFDAASINKTLQNASRDPEYAAKRGHTPRDIKMLEDAQALLPEPPQKEWQVSAFEGTPSEDNNSGSEEVSLFPEERQLAIA